jgi:acetoacetyl-CoA reductase/3-oxoacyl-[acyl-carrier protein] reductase
VKRIALVTGGSRGIGKAIVAQLASEGTRVAFTYKQHKEKAVAIAKDLEKKGCELACLELDQSKGQSIQRAIDKTHELLGRIDILVNNAALAQEKPFESITEDDWHAMLDTNLLGPFVLCQKVLPDMKERGWGRIINVTSIGGQWGGFNQVHYAMAKAGLINLTMSVAKICGRYGITSNAVSPGLVDTEMIAGELSTPAGKEKLKSIPMGRLATPEEVANVVAFLASEKASYITGQTINVNGGMYFG